MVTPLAQCLDAHQEDQAMQEEGVEEADGAGHLVGEDQTTLGTNRELEGGKGLPRLLHRVLRRQGERRAGSWGPLPLCGRGLGEVQPQDFWGMAPPAAQCQSLQRMVLPEELLGRGKGPVLFPQLHGPSCQGMGGV